MPLPLPLDLWLPGTVPYKIAWDWQKQRLASMQTDNRPDALLLLCHPPVYTLGQGATPDFLKFDPDICEYEVHRVERGGEVTYHGPGQWVGYPLLNLRRYQQDLHWYMRQLEQVLIDVLTTFDICGERIDGLTGVWVEGAKLGAIGIRATKWITWHGFSLNVCPELGDFSRIVPCGIGDRPVGSLEQFVPGISMEEVQPLIISSIEAVFGLQAREMDGERWLGSVIHLEQ
ncbi:MAG: lipoyl(octanoyl) transferase LipB [Cyanobacteria bacterium P01_E01_bin.34]